MTLDEAIEHAETKSIGENLCAKEHHQLAEWLKELRMYRLVQGLSSKALNKTSISIDVEMEETATKRKLGEERALAEIKERG